MAHVYVRSGAAGAGTGADWANAYTKLSTAFAAKAAGDNFWIAADHAESEGAAITLTPSGATAVSIPCTAICVTHTGTVPPVAADLRTTAVIATGAGAFALAFGTGRCYYYGITFKSGTGAVSAVINVTGAGWTRFDSCQFWKPGTTGTASAVTIRGSAGATSDDRVELNNCTCKFGATTDACLLGGSTQWRNNGSSAFDATGTTPSTLFYWSNSANALLEGLDLSNMASTNLMTSGTGQGVITFHKCKFHASLQAIPAMPVAARLDIINSNSGAVNYRTDRYQNMGSQVIETTIVRTGGASDGTTPIAWKIVTSSVAKWVQPFESLPMAIWNDTTGSNVTVTVYGTWGGGAVPNNDDIWMEISYLGASGAPIATLNTANGKASYLATNAAQTSDSSTWGGSTTEFKMVVTLSSPQPAMKGLIYVTVKAAAVSSTFYIDPRIELS